MLVHPYVHLRVSAWVGGWVCRGGAGGGGSVCCGAWLRVWPHCTGSLPEDDLAKLVVQSSKFGSVRMNMEVMNRKINWLNSIRRGAQCALLPVQRPAATSRPPHRRPALSRFTM